MKPAAPIPRRLRPVAETGQPDLVGDDEDGHHDEEGIERPIPGDVVQGSYSSAGPGGCPELTVLGPDRGRVGVSRTIRTGWARPAPGFDPIRRRPACRRRAPTGETTSASKAPPGVATTADVPDGGGARLVPPGGRPVDHRRPGLPSPPEVVTTNPPSGVRPVDGHGHPPEQGGPRTPSRSAGRQCSRGRTARRRCRVPALTSAAAPPGIPSSRITSVGPDFAPGSRGPTGSQPWPADSKMPGRSPRGAGRADERGRRHRCGGDARVSLSIPHEEVEGSAANVRLETTGVHVGQVAGAGDHRPATALQQGERVPGRRCRQRVGHRGQVTEDEARRPDALRRRCWLGQGGEVEVLRRPESGQHRSAGHRHRQSTVAGHAGRGGQGPAVRAVGQGEQLPEGVERVIEVAHGQRGPAGARVGPGAAEELARGIGGRVAGDEAGARRRTGRRRHGQQGDGAERRRPVRLTRGTRLSASGGDRRSRVADVLHLAGQQRREGGPARRTAVARIGVEDLAGVAGPSMM